MKTRKLFNYIVYLDKYNKVEYANKIVENKVSTQKLYPYDRGVNCSGKYTTEVLRRRYTRELISFQ